MTFLRHWAAAAAASLLLAACGGGGSDTPETVGSQGAPRTAGNFTSVVSFGDSLSDAGSYAPATSLSGNGAAPYLGGRFTTNANDANGNSTARVWVENLAASIGLPLTPHEVGFAGQSVKCPAAAVPVLANSCTAYGQGGARVTDPQGIGNNNGTGALTVPVQTQIANHLARFGSFKPTDLIFVFAGANDVLVQYGIFANAAAGFQAQAQGGTITAAQANQQTQQALRTAQQDVARAAQELATYVRGEILAKGGRYVAAVTVPDLTATPFGRSAQVPDSLRPALGTLVDSFNLSLSSALNGQPVDFVDANAYFRSLIANPAAVGLTNVTDRVCDPAKIAAVTGGRVADGSSLFCNVTPGAPFNGQAAGADPATWLFADSVHPTTALHQLFADEVKRQLTALGWF